MARNLAHGLQLESNAEEAARQRFSLALKRSLESLRPALRPWYERDIEGQLEPDAGYLDVADALYRDERYLTLARLRRTAQELMWQAVAAPLVRQQATLEQCFREHCANPLGSLRLDPAVRVPSPLAGTAIHLQPGGYARDLGADDVLAGALYDAGGALYSQGQKVGTKEGKAELVIRRLSELFPGWRPQRVLDMACSAGSSAIPYALAYPGAEVHAIDVAPALLRYAHAKAESIGAPVHFSQQDVGQTDFADASFDLVVSHNALHEMSQSTQRAMFAESYRLLKPGGICVHQDVPLRFDRLDRFLQAEYSFDQWFNGEPHWADYAEHDCLSALREAGFITAVEDFWVQSDNTFRWYVVWAQKPLVDDAEPQA